MKEAQNYGKNRIGVNQIPYNLSARNKNYKGKFAKMESEIIPYCQANDVIVMAYRPVERGFLLKPHPLLDEMSAKYDKTKAQIAINWLISKKNIITIPKSSSIEHLKENLGALGWNLEEHDMEILDRTDFGMPDP